MSLNELRAAFEEYFELVPALTDELRREAYRLRYEVMSKEFELPGLESWRYASGLESDEYDYRAVNYLLRHRASSILAGTVRLILADPLDIHAYPSHLDRSLPIERLAASFDRNVVDPTSLRRDQIGEVSRLIISRMFRRRKGEDEFPFGTDRLITSEHHERRHFPHPVLGLIVALFRISAEYGINYCYAAMEPALNRLLQRFALDLIPIGPLLEYHGYRQPYFMSVSEVLTNTYQRNRAVWDLITQGGALWPVPNVSLNR